MEPSIFAQFSIETFNNFFDVSYSFEVQKLLPNYAELAEKNSDIFIFVFFLQKPGKNWM